jgi:transcriptional regulator with XRE-family HTH domain
MEFCVYEDIEVILTLLDVTIQEFANELGVSYSTVSRWKERGENVSPANLEKIYEYAFKKRIRLNKIKEQLFREECLENHALLFHGAKTDISGHISVEKSRRNNDFGQGFYCGESLEQSAMFVSNYPHASLYMLDFDKTGMQELRLGVEQDWMLMIAFFRGKLTAYENHPIIQRILNRLNGIDYVVAPIADNRMFQIIDSFIEGEITDVQCRHCLSATNLGNQYVFLTQRAADRIQILRKCYLASVEKEAYISIRSEDTEVSNDKVKIARKQYRGQGKYIEDILV